MTPEAYALEVKRSRSYRGQRMSSAQRRRAAIGERGRLAFFDPQDTARSARLGGTVSRNGRLVGGGRLSIRRNVDDLGLRQARRQDMGEFGMADRPPSPTEVSLGGPAKRSTGRAARSRRLAAAGSFTGMGKDAQRRMAAIQRERSQYVGARSRVRSFISANRRGG